MKRSASAARPPGLSRRAFLRNAGAVSALLGAGPFLAAADEDDFSITRAQAAGAATFAHGVASGDPLADRVILWTRVTPDGTAGDVAVDWQVATDPALQVVVASGSATARRAGDFTVKVDATGLDPGTTYYYRFATGPVLSPVGRTKTLPVGDVARLRLAVASCAAIGQGWFNAYSRIAARADLDLVVHLGDYVYEYGTGEYGSVRDCEPSHEIVTLRDYRTRHNQYKADADVQALHRQHPLIAIWDDHEFADNAWKGGAANHQPDTEGAWDTRVKNAVRAYYEWMPIRPVAHDHRKIARSFRLGDLAELFLLEERVTARDEQAAPNVVGDTPLFTEDGDFVDAGRRLISRQQEHWLVDGLRKSDAQWKLIGQGVQIAPVRVGVTPEGENVFFNPDQWDGYQPARQRLLRAIAGTGPRNPVENVVVLTGDIHSSWAADLPLDPFGPHYQADSGAGSIAVEFVATSISSPGFDDIDGQGAESIQAINPHLKYVELTRRGYVVLDVDRQRVSSEWWYVDTVLQPDGGESFGIALETRTGTAHVSPGVESLPVPGAPAPAP